MPVAALYDIHGNLPALDAVLQEVQRIGVDRTVIGGDVLPGPMSRETLVGAAVASIRRTAYPQAEQFAAQSVLLPPSEESVLASFACVEVAAEPGAASDTGRR